MKCLIVSDIHGSSYYMKFIEGIISQENFDKIILLGDLYYHGPRNKLPMEYDTMNVCNILNKYKDKIIAIKGNCDALVDEEISEFKLNENLCYCLDGLNVYMTHGHIYNKKNLPNVYFDVMLYGHLHIPFIESIDGKYFINPGSISLPKNNSKHSYILYEDRTFTIKDENNNIIDSIKIN